MWRRWFGDEMSIAWGTTTDDANYELIGCRDHAFVAAAEILDNLFRRSTRAKCPYSRTLTGYDLMRRSHEIDFVPYLGDRVVLYGANPSGVTDLVRPPTSQPVPGVYLTAMALDNLITFGPRYLRHAPESGRNLALWTLAIIATGLLIPGYHAWVRTDVVQNRSGPRKLATWLGSFALLGLAQLAIGIVGLVGLRLAPLNWVGFLMLGAVLLSPPFRRFLRDTSKHVDKQIKRTEV